MKRKLKFIWNVLVGKIPVPEDVLKNDKETIVVRLPFTTGIAKTIPYNIKPFDIYVVTEPYFCSTYGTPNSLWVNDKLDYTNPLSRITGVYDSLNSTITLKNESGEKEISVVISFVER